jgi:hypothetical protein
MFSSKVWQQRHSKRCPAQYWPVWFSGLSQPSQPRDSLHWEAYFWRGLTLHHEQIASLWHIVSLVFRLSAFSEKGHSIGMAGKSKQSMQVYWFGNFN